MTVTDNTRLGGRSQQRLTRIAGRDVSQPDGHTVGKTFSRKFALHAPGRAERCAGEPAVFHPNQNTQLQNLTYAVGLIINEVVMTIKNQISSVARKASKARIIATALVAASVANLSAQAIKSPEIQADQKVTFRLMAPNAKQVMLSVEGTKAVAMAKSEKGLWSFTTEPMAPDYYGYNFVVDGVSLMDPSNPLKKPNYLWQSSEVHIPGENLPWEVSNVPHGVIHRHFYHSDIVADNRDFFVYTPAAYDTTPGEKYPVLYLQHGFSDDASGWTTVGRAHVIMDNLISQKKAKPMLVVMSLGYGAPEILKPDFSGWSNQELVSRNFTKFTETLLKEVMPQVEKKYRVKTDRQSRAIAGLSMGGSETLLTALNHPDQFSYAGAFSSGGLPTPFNSVFPSLDAKTNEQLKLLWISCGTEDGLIQPNRLFCGWLKEKGIKCTTIETAGAHTWMVWRRNLVEFVPLLFQK
jgi:enterochelin esterase-like enzyme